MCMHIFNYVYAEENLFLRGIRMYTLIFRHAVLFAFLIIVSNNRNEESTRAFKEQKRKGRKRYLIA